MNVFLPVWLFEGVEEGVEEGEGRELLFSGDKQRLGGNWSAFDPLLVEDILSTVMTSGEGISAQKEGGLQPTLRGRGGRPGLPKFS